ncbi:probable disease resistance protein RPP1 isoform X2 [Capsella rubella]|uniref:probable disease resistance protein RPP1 isoform X2 n=1 Tax=Capsella rubella TaxID=81985 RepID=UPI000CD53717|nr:probable disease resistance protein RPP1 isoform X2 [Capsella rubella]
MTIFYDVDPTDVKKQTGDFGKVFNKTCRGKTKDEIKRWRKALESVATIAGEHSRNWDNEAAMTEKIATDVSNMLNLSTPSRDFDGLVGMGAHMKEMESLLCMGSDKVRMIGIWGPSGIDSIDQSIQLDSIAKETHWFGHGSRIIITTQDKKLLEAHGINHIYKVEFPSTYEACQIFCLYAFGQNFPKDGFEELAWQVTILLGELPLGLRVMGSYFRGMSKQEWISALPRLRTRLDGNIKSILKFSYDALCGEDKDLFLHIACFFNYHCVEKVEGYLAHKFFDVSQRLQLLAKKSLISIERGDIYNGDRWIEMHNPLVQLGRDIVRHSPGNQSINEPWKHQFLVDARDICEVLYDNTGTSSVIGINFDPYKALDGMNISERAFEGMSNLQFLRFNGPHGDQSDKSCLPQSLNYLSRKLILLEWNLFPMTFLPFNFCTEYLVALEMKDSNIQKLWEGHQSPRNLKWINLRGSKNLNELPDLSAATKLQELILTKCESLMEIPTSIGNNTNIQKLYLGMCTSLVELPFSIGKLHKLQELQLQGCSKLAVLPININLKSLDKLNLTNCLLLKSFPEISTNIKDLKLMRTAIREVPTSIKSWSRLHDLEISYNENILGFSHALAFITKLHFKDTETKEIPSWVNKIPRLETLILEGYKKLVAVPQLSVSYQWIENGQSLEKHGCSFYNHPKKYLKFTNRLKLNKETRQLIQTSITCALLPSRKVPANFTHRGNSGCFVIVSLKQRPLSTILRFKACILLVNDNNETTKEIVAYYDIMDKHKSSVIAPAYSFIVPPFLTEHLLTFELEAEVTSNELLFKLHLDSNEVRIKEYGVLQL